jgi:hypothetical protein
MNILLTITKIFLLILSIIMLCVVIYYFSYAQRKNARIEQVYALLGMKKKASYSGRSYTDIKLHIDSVLKPGIDDETSVLHAIKGYDDIKYYTNIYGEDRAVTFFYGVPSLVLGENNIYINLYFHKGTYTNCEVANEGP